MAMRCVQIVPASAEAGALSGALAGPMPAWVAAALETEFGELAATIGHRWLSRFQGQLDVEHGCVPAARHLEYLDLLQLLLEYAIDDGAHTAAIARWIAVTCMGDDHLWEDLGLPERPALSAMISRHFPALYAINTGNMRWKRFFYKQLCEREEVYACRSPSCGECSEYSHCFDVGDDAGG